MSRGKDIGVGGAEGGTPRAAVARLSLYLRELESLHRAGAPTVSSSRLGSPLEITDAQVRKDLAYFGQFGYPGLGYKVAELRDSLRAILGTDRTWRLGLVGVGNLGRALLGYNGFKHRGFVISAIFDASPRMIGETLDGLVVQPMDRLPELARTLALELAILAVPAAAAEDVARRCVDAGITGILNFAPVQLKVSEEVCLVSVDMGLLLEQLVFQVNQRRIVLPGEDA